MDIVTLQQNIVDQILTQLTTDEAQIVVMPEDDNDFQRPKDQKGKVVVGYQQSEFSDTVVTHGVAQAEKPLIIITLQSRSLYGESGIYPMFKKVRKAVLGFTPADCEIPLKAKYFGPPESFTKPHDGEVWTYEYHVETRCMSIDEQDQSGTVAPMSQDTWQLNIPDDTTDRGADFMINGPSALIEFREP